MEYQFKNFLADLAPRAGWDEATLEAISASIESGELTEEHAKLLKETASNIGTTEFFKNDRSGNSLASHFRSEAFDGVTNDTLNAFLDQFGDLLDPSEIKLAFSNSKQKFSEKRDSVLKAIRAKYEEKMKNLVNSESVNKLIEEKDRALQDAREKIKKAKEQEESRIAELQRQFESDIIRRDLAEMVNSLPLSNPAQAKAAARFLEIELNNRFRLVRTANGIEARSLEDPNLPATDPETKTTVTVPNFAKAVLNEHGFLARNKGSQDTPPPPQPPASNGDVTQTPPGIAAGSHQDAMLKIYERFRPQQQQ